MGARKLTRWQKAGALVPMAVLVGAWGAALGNSDLAGASDDDSAAAIPAVPATAFEQPASVQKSPAGIDQKADTAQTISNLSTNGIPAAALFAYRRAENLLGKADKSCQLPWNLVAAIGRVESNHGRSNGNALNSDGVATPGIFGVPLDGKDGRARITDTDGGALDKDPVLDLAVGPMQFIPGTWKSIGVDSDNDGTKNPQDIDDAATSAGIYLCAGAGDLSDPVDAAATVKRYNNSDAYVDLVLKISAAYAKGDFTQSPNGLSASPLLTSPASDQTVTPDERKKAARAEKAAQDPIPANKATTTDSNEPVGGSGGSGGGSGSGSGGDEGSGGSGGSTPEPTPTSKPKPGGTIGGGVQDLVDNTPLAPLAPVTQPVTDLLSGVEANLQCLLKFPLGLPKSKFDICVYDLTH